MSLFGGRTDAHGTWEGGSKKSPVSYETFAKHLYGEELIGIYPLTDGSTVRWGCSDIDIDDLDSARNLQVAFGMKSIPSFVEKTVRGFHVWVFANDWIPAPIMRRAFLSAHEVIGLAPKEVNPKQEQVNGLGNYVRLPYPGGIDYIPESRYTNDTKTFPRKCTRVKGQHKSFATPRRKASPQDPCRTRPTTNISLSPRSTHPCECVCQKHLEERTIRVTR